MALKSSYRFFIEEEVNIFTKGVVYGDSITVYAYADNVDLAYVNLMRNILNIPIQTTAKFSRSIVDDIVNFDPKNSLQHIVDNPDDPDHVFDVIYPYETGSFLLFRLGINDVLKLCSNGLQAKWYNDGIDTGNKEDIDVDYFVEYFIETYIHCLNYFHNEQGYPWESMALVNIGYYNIDIPFNQDVHDRIQAAILTVAQTLAIQHIDLGAFNLANNLSNSANWYVDEVHPGNLGHSEEAAFIADQIISGGSETPPFDITLNSYEAMNTYAYNASIGKKYGTNNNAIDNDSMGSFTDLKGTEYDLLYSTDPISATPAIIGRPPYLRKNKGFYPYIKFENVPHTEYVSDIFRLPNNDIDYVTFEQGHSTTFVIQYLPLQGAEALINNYGGKTYIGELNGGLRVWVASEYRLTDTTALPEFFKRSVLYVEYRRDFISVWLDGVYKGQVANDIPEDGPNISDAGKILNALGVSTNSANFIFYAMYIATRDDATSIRNDRTAYLASIQTKFNAGIFEERPHVNPFKPLFNEITRVWSNRNIDADYNIIIPEEEVTATNATQQQYDDRETQWWIRLQNDNPGQGGDFAPWIFLSTGRTLSESEYQSYIDDETGISIISFINVGNWEFIPGIARSIFSPYT